MEITYSQYSYLFNSLFTKYYPENFLLSFNLSKVVYIYLSNNGYLTQGKMPLGDYRNASLLKCLCQVSCFGSGCSTADGFS